MGNDPANLFISLFLPFLLESLSKLLLGCLQAQPGSWGCPRVGYSQLSWFSSMQIRADCCSSPTHPRSGWRDIISSLFLLGNWLLWAS